jgi:hypothetical protein
MFYHRNPDNLPPEWIAKTRRVIELTESSFTTQRMLADYLTKLYL